MLRCPIQKNQWCTSLEVEQRLATASGKHETDGADPV